MNVKEYKKIIEIPHPDRVFYDFEYQFNDCETRFIRFIYEEHSWQFEELLNQAGYTKVN